MVHTGRQSFFLLVHCPPPKSATSCHGVEVVHSCHIYSSARKAGLSNQFEVCNLRNVLSTSPDVA